MRFMLTALTIFIFLTPTARADEFEQKAIRMLELSNAVQPSLDMMNNMLITMSPGMVNQMHQQFNATGKSVTRKDVEGLVVEYRNRVVERFAEELVPIMVDQLRLHFTDQEIDDLNRLMATPEFQAYAQKLPAVMATAQKAGEQMGAKIGMEVMTSLIAANPKFQ